MLKLLVKLIQRKFRCPLHAQIDQYCAWKSVRYSTVAASHREVLISFMRYSKLKTTSLITTEHVEAYANSFPSQHYQNQATKVLRQFCRYWYKMGLLTEEFSRVIKKDIISDMEELVSPRLHLYNVKRVKELRQTLVHGKPMTFRAIQMKMEGEDKKKYDLKTLHRWATYNLPEGV